MNKHDDEPFLSRWSRMKQRAVRTDAPVGQTLPATELNTASPPDHIPSEAEVALVKEGETQPPLDLEKLPRVDELTAESDIAAFLDLRVPAALRNAALARMWTLDPTIRDFIEVAENQWNWNIPGGAPFYELIEEGSTSSLSFADATSAISRTLTPTDAPVDAKQPQPEDPIEISDQRKVDLADGNRAAAHQELTDPPLTSVSRLDSSRLPYQVVEAPSPDEAAAQQNYHLSRRRHGGALPG